MKLTLLSKPVIIIIYDFHVAAACPKWSKLNNCLLSHLHPTVTPNLIIISWSAATANPTSPARACIVPHHHHYNFTWAHQTKNPIPSHPVLAPRPPSRSPRLISTSSWSPDHTTIASLARWAVFKILFAAFIYQIYIRTGSLQVNIAITKRQDIVYQ